MGTKTAKCHVRPLFALRMHKRYWLARELSLKEIFIYGYQDT